ncbi:MAG: phosphatidate cytidylyltransferase [Thermodesulfobacteriota bacterium]
MHAQRWITALVALPFLIWLIYQGGLVFSMFIGLVSLIGLWEYYHIVCRDTEDIVRSPIAITGFITGILTAAAAHAGAEAVVPTLLALDLAVAGFFGLVRYKREPEAMALVMKQVAGVVYVPLMLAQIVMLRRDPHGAAWVFFLLFLVFFGDIGAFYAGRFWGRRKLYPAVSPGKTIEGALGGLGASVGIGFLFRALFLPELPLGGCLILFLGVGVAGPMGDLFESALKRAANVKDSGTILPGHGGLLDRIDALLFAAPLAFFFKAYILT